MNIKDKIKLYEENIINGKKKIYKKIITDKTNVRKKVYEWDNINKLENNIIVSESPVVEPVVVKKKNRLNNNIGNGDEDEVENSVINM